MRKTVLEMTQNILSKMTSDEVNSISDTVEAEQVARIIRDFYEDIVADMDISFKGELINLESATDDAHPTRLKMPEAVSKVHWINYRKPVTSA